MLKLLDEGADVKLKDPVGNSCLHYAVVCGNYESIRHLVMYGADLEQENIRNGYKPIHLCLSENKEKCLEELLKHGAQVNAVDSSKNTLLHLVLKFTPKDLDFIEKLLNYGFDPNITNITGNNCLHIIAASRSCTATESLLLAKKFIKKGVDIDHVNNATGETPLQMASRTGKIHLVDLLLREGAAMDVRSHLGFTAFERLFFGNRPKIDIVAIFIKHIALKKHRGETVQDSVSQKIASDAILRAIYRSYDEDLNRLKSIEIVETHWVTLHHILCRKKSDVINYLRSTSVRDNILSQEVSTIYRKEIWHKVSELVKIVIFQEVSCRVVDEVLDGRLPYLCVEQISKYLSENEVKELYSLLLKSENID
ncbi:ankyrin-3-like [Coccinella septempunctata]|uniref:ankyrin-3-like n=1 Tax=Coccinella septempunctata TaxID=41139 RepID=UPI001D095F7C|nr:ankyrin-3-like [Coccinella septempunctata]